MQARQKLTPSGFKLDVRKQESSATKAGKVLDQSPVGGERVKKDPRPCYMSAMGQRL